MAWIACLRLLVSCQAGSPADASPETHRPATDGGTISVIYSWVDDRGQIHMASDVEEIPEAFRDRVVVSDTSRPRAKRLTLDRMVVVDLREESGGKPINYTVVDLEALQRRPEPLPKDAGELGRWVVDRAADKVRRLLRLSTPLPSAVVVLYVAPWCGFCKKAAQHLRSKGVVFEERDIERDRSAAVELSRKLRYAGLSDGGVPVLDIGGTLVIGFEKERIDRLLQKL